MFVKSTPGAMLRATAETDVNKIVGTVKSISG
jgi:hypothetical protein